jgi:hypothetical protein
MEVGSLLKETPCGLHPMSDTRQCGASGLSLIGEGAKEGLYSYIVKSVSNANITGYAAAAAAAACCRIIKYVNVTRFMELQSINGFLASDENKFILAAVHQT